jgi:hypothetical protein
MNSGFMLSHAWHPLFNLLIKVRQHIDEHVLRDAKRSDMDLGQKLERMPSRQRRDIPR